MAPRNKVSIPLKNQCALVNLVFPAPRIKRNKSTETADKDKASDTFFTRKNGAIAGSVPRKKDTLETKPISRGLSMLSGLMPISSWIINLSQRFLSEVILLTAISCSSVVKPISLKISLISAVSFWGISSISLFSLSIWLSKKMLLGLGGNIRAEKYCQDTRSYLD